jgi:hypothetical protein
MLLVAWALCTALQTMKSLIEARKVLESFAWVAHNVTFDRAVCAIDGPFHGRS